MNPKTCQDANVIADWFHPWWQSWHHDKSWFLVYISSMQFCFQFYIFMIMIWYRPILPIPFKVVWLELGICWISSWKWPKVPVPPTIFRSNSTLKKLVQSKWNFAHTNTFVLSWYEEIFSCYDVCKIFTLEDQYFSGKSNKIFFSRFLLWAHNFFVK